VGFIFCNNNYYNHNHRDTNYTKTRKTRPNVEQGKTIKIKKEIVYYTAYYAYIILLNFGYNRPTNN